jgi:hypothetical protein
MTVYNLGTVVVKAKLFEEAIALMLATGNLGILKVEAHETETPEEDGEGTVLYSLIVEGHTLSTKDERVVGRGNYTRRETTPYVRGIYTLPVTKSVEETNQRSLGRGVFVDLLALHKLARAAKMSTEITVHLNSEIIQIRGANFVYTLQTAATKREQNAIMQRQIDRQYGFLSEVR